VQKAVPAETWESFLEVLVLRRVEEELGTSVRGIAAAEGIGAPLVSRILHEQLHCPYHMRGMKALTPPDHRARVFCMWLLG
jgi:hypothetical protein